jgi:hypothetical protein
LAGEIERLNGQLEEAKGKSRAKESAKASSASMSPASSASSLKPPSGKSHIPVRSARASLDSRMQQQQLKNADALQEINEQLRTKLAATEATVRQVARKARQYRTLLAESGLVPASSLLRRSSSESMLDRLCDDSLEDQRTPTGSPLRPHSKSAPALLQQLTAEEMEQLAAEAIDSQDPDQLRNSLQTIKDQLRLRSHSDPSTGMTSPLTTVSPLNDTSDKNGVAFGGLKDQIENLKSQLLESESANQLLQRQLLEATLPIDGASDPNDIVTPPNRDQFVLKKSRFILRQKTPSCRNIKLFVNQDVLDQFFAF